ncbi:Methyltransferase domain protein [compost metagenome]
MMKLINKIGYGVVDALFYTTLKLEELIRSTRLSLSLFSDKRLDRMYNIETQMIPNSTYIPISTKVFKQIVKKTKLPEQIHFFDYGSGKGKALILALQNGFEHVSGIELSSELVEISQRNLQNYLANVKKQVQVNVICEDATKYDELDEYNIFFFNNSFGGNPSEERMVARIFKKIETSLKNKPRQANLIYVHPGISLQMLFDSYSWLKDRKVIQNSTRPKYDKTVIYIFTIHPDMFVGGQI